MRRRQNIPKVASKVIAIAVPLILALAFVFQIGYHLGRRSSSAKLTDNADSMPGAVVASPIEAEVKEEQNIPKRESEEKIRNPEKVESTKPPVIKTVMPKPTIPPKLYTVQVGAFRYVSNAKELAAKISSKGYTVWINPPIEHSSLHIVRVGKFDSRRRAESFGKNIKARFDLEEYLVVLMQ